MSKLLLSTSQQSVSGLYVGGQITIALGNDGVSVWNYENMCRVQNLPLGSSAWILTGAAILCANSSFLCFPLMDCHTQQFFLASCSLKKPGPTALADAPKVGLPAELLSLHCLRLPNSESEFAAAVLKSGDIAWLIIQHDSVPQEVLVMKHIKNSVSNQSILQAASSSGNMLALFSQSKTNKTNFYLQQYEWTNQSLQASGPSLPVQCPAPQATCVDFHYTRAFSLVTWSNGMVSVMRHSHTTHTSHSPSLLHLDFSKLLISEQLSSPRVPKASEERKRKAQQAGSSTTSTQVKAMAVAPVDASQFIVISTNTENASIARCALIDTQFGCETCSWEQSLDTGSTHSLPALSGNHKPLMKIVSGITASPAVPGLLLLQLGGAVYCMKLNIPTSSLLSMVGRLHTSSASNHQYPNPPSSNGSFTSLDLHVLSRIASSGPQQSSATAAVPLTLAEAPPDVCSTSSPTHPGLDYQAVLKLLQTPTQPGQTAVLKEALDQFLSASRHSNPLSLVSLLAQRLAEGELWDELQRLLDTIPSGTSQGCLLPGATCSWILPTAARAQRYRLLSPLCSCLDDASPDQVVEALAVLLQPTTASNLTLRKAHFMNIRSHAEAAIAQSERAISSLPGNSSRHRALALAKCAAAVVDGFTAQEVLIHPLLAMPLDVPALQGRLAELNNYHVDRLLSYLAKWMDKYTQELGDVAAQIPLPVELLFPTLTQVLEWVRLLLDSHLARLLMAQQTLPCLGQITSCVNLQVSACKSLLPLLGCAEHIQQHAPLPAAHVATATQYTVELLDLSVK